jgi:DNA-binding XRE family transcriptional regulator
MDAGGFTMSVDAETRLAALLREARLRRNMTQEDAAAALSVSRPCISHLEAGTRSVKVTELLVLCDLYETPYTVIVDRMKRKARGGGAA